MLSFAVAVRSKRTQSAAQATHPLAGLLAPALFLVLVPPFPAHHVVTKPRDGVILLVPVIDFIHGAVGGAIIAGAVMPNPEKRSKQPVR